MVIDDFHLIGIATIPTETDPELIVYPDTVLTATVALKSLQAIPRRNSQVLKVVRTMKQEQFTSGDPFNGAKPSARTVMKQPLCFPAFEAFDHSVPPSDYSVKRNNQ